MSRRDGISRDACSFLYGAPGCEEECRRLRRYIRGLQAAHRKQIDALLAQLRESGRQIAELRIEAGLAASSIAAGCWRGARGQKEITTQQSGSKEMTSNGMGGGRRADGKGGGRRRGGTTRRRIAIRASRRRAVKVKRTYARNLEPRAKRNFLSRRGAEALARQIENYWRSLGFNVRTWLVPVKWIDGAETPPEETKLPGEETPASGDVSEWKRRGNIWCVRSSLANGLPPGPANPFFGTDCNSDVRFHRADVRYTEVSPASERPLDIAKGGAATSLGHAPPAVGKTRRLDDPPSGLRRAEK